MRKTNKSDMTITEQLHEIREHVCDTLCKYREAFESGDLSYPETTTAQDFFEEHYCEKCRMREV